MPGNDRTGPAGLGPATGRGMGSCGGGSARGRGFGFRNNYPRTLTKEEEKKILEAEKKELEKELEEVNKALEKQ